MTLVSKLDRHGCSVRSVALYGTLLAVAGLSTACDSLEGRDASGLQSHSEPSGGKADDANGGAGSTFDREAIVSDRAMLDATALTAAEVDAFLADPYEDGLPSCLIHEKFDGKTAGQLLVEAAREYQLNPLFLIVHLQKESSLVGALGTCSTTALDEAFGCGCPDGAGCAPEFAGFQNQVECAADRTRAYLQDLDAGRTTISGWGVNTTKSTLDPISITPRNRATAVLYTYTPWVGQHGAGGNAAPFGNYLFWQVWVRYANTLGYTVPGGSDPEPPAPMPEPEPEPDTPSPEPPGGQALANWNYVLQTDMGLRSDGLGEGHFMAPRSGGRLHNGLDILGLPGSTLSAPCSGEALSGVEGSFGQWVQLVCPVELAGNTVWASMLYSHLEGRDVGASGWQEVSAGASVGRLGSSGNAAGTNPHVHFEIIFHESRNAALNEFHSGGDNSNNATSDQVLALFQEHCFAPHGLDSKEPDVIVRYGRRFDPYLALICLGADKAAYQAPPAALQSVPVPWSRWYTATTFDVDREHL